jgi:phosphoserine phosphatase
MRVAVFDFDGTLVYSPSSLVWTSGLSFCKKMAFPMLYVFEKITGKSLYQKKAFEWLVGKDVRKIAETLKELPEVKGGVKKFRELSKSGHRMIVMSFSPGYFVRAWLNAKGLEAEVICPDIVVESGIVKKVSEDYVTEMFIEHPIEAKRKVLEKKKIKPDVCVGDSYRRDAVCGNYIDIAKLEPNYQNTIIQGIRMIVDYLFK